MSVKTGARKAFRYLYNRSGLRAWMTDDAPHALTGDRCIEWQWVLDKLPAPPARVLDIGCVHSYTAGIAAVRGLEVTGVDLLDLGYGLPHLTFLRGDATKLDLPESHFDRVVLCSTIEHVGLEGRFSSGEEEGGDLALMRLARRWLRPEGRLLLTIPVGRDAVFRPMHRIYGERRLPKLTGDYEVVEEAYWVRTPQRAWQPAPRPEALAFEGSADLYALGLFSLKAEGK
jgi:SAM-dependent methyltransferase